MQTERLRQSTLEPGHDRGVRPATTLALALILVALFGAVIFQFAIQGGPGGSAGTTTVAPVESRPLIEPGSGQS